MKKIIKTILIIIFFICFLGLFLSPRPAFSSDFGDTVVQSAYDTTSEWLDYMQTGQDEVLSKFFTYAYVGVKSRSIVDGEFVETERRYCLVVTGVVNSGSYTQWSCNGVGTCYYETGSPAPVFANQTIRIYSNRLEIVGTAYYFESNFDTHNRIVTYCDLPQTYFTQETDPLSVIDLNIAHYPPPEFGSISSQVGSLGDNIQDTLNRWIPPVPETTPTFQPPETLPPFYPPTVTVTAFPAVTDSNGSYYMDYSPYIYGDFYSPPNTEDILLSPALSASGALISEGYNWLTDSGMFSVFLVLMLVSFAIYNLI